MAEMNKDIKISRYWDIKKIKTWLKKYTQGVFSVYSQTTPEVVLDYGTFIAVVIIIFLLIFSYFLPKNQFQQAKERLARNPNDFEAHLILAEEYLKNNQLEEAEKEILFAEKIQTSNYLLNQIKKRKKELNPDGVKELIEYWKKIITEKPNYRDGHLRLSVLYYKLYQNEKAQEYLQKTLELDPNFEPARELEKILKDKND